MKRTTLIAVVAGGVVLVLLWYFLLFAPTSSKLDDTRGQVSNVESQNQELENTIRRLKELSRNAPQQEATLRTLRAAIPANPDLAEFILQANDIASASAIDFLSIAPSPPVATTTGGPPSTIGLSIQIDGGFFEVLDYLNRLEDLERLVLVDTINVSAGGASDSTTAGGSTSGEGTASTGGAPDLSVSLTGRMFTGAAPPAGTGGSTITPTPTTPGATTPGATTPTTPGATTPPASSSGSSS